MSLSKITLDYVASDGQTLRAHLLTREADRVQRVVARPQGVEPHRLRGRLRALQQIALAEGFARALARRDLERAQAHHNALIQFFEVEFHEANVSLCHPGDDESRGRAQEWANQSGRALAAQRAVGDALFRKGGRQPDSCRDAMADLAALLTRKEEADGYSDFPPFEDDGDDPF
jgi:hypothetical protein